MPAVAEVLCQGCGARQTRSIPVIARPWLVPLCDCGERPQVVRVFADRKRGKADLPDSSAAARLAARARAAASSNPAPANGA